MDWLNDPSAWIGLVTLTVMEIVLGIDNIVFISILAGKLPESQQDKARTLGLALAMITRIMLLLSLSWVMRLTTPLFNVGELGISGRDLILILGGCSSSVKRRARSTTSWKATTGPKSRDTRRSKA